MKLLVDLLFGLIFSLSLSGLGIFLARKILKIELDFLTGFFAGCGICIIILFVSGVLGIFSYTYFLIYIIAVFIFSIAGRRALMSLRFSIEKKHLLPLVLLAIVLLLTGLASLSPPIKNDTLYYHLGLPKLWAGDGAIEFYPWLSFSATALNSEVLLTPIISFVSPEAAQFFIFIVGLMVILLLGRVYGKYFDGSPASAVLIVGTVSFFIAGLFDAKNDYLAAGFALTAMMFYLDYLRHDDLKNILLSGIFAGLAASTKANSLIFTLALTLVVLFSRPRLRHVMIFLAAGFVFGGPWYIKSFIQTGNPFYPFFNELFNASIWRDLFTDFNRATGVDSEHRGLVNFITSPFRLVYLPDIFRARIGPLPFVLLPGLLFIKKVPVAIRKILLIAAIFYPLWYIAWPNGRYLMPAVILLCLAAAHVLDWIGKRSSAALFMVMVSVSVLIGLNGIQVYRDSGARAKAALGLIDRPTFLKTVAALDPNNIGSSAMTPAIPYYDVWQYINTVTEIDAVVGIFCSNWQRADGFYLDRRYIYLNPSDQVVVDFTGNRYSMAQAIVNNNIRYVVLDRNALSEFYPDSKFAGAPGFDKLSHAVGDFIDIVKQNGRLVYFTDRFELYRMKNLSAILEGPFS